VLSRSLSLFSPVSPVLREETRRSKDGEREEKGEKRRERER
jgi:hypothetical protein